MDPDLAPSLEKARRALDAARRAGRPADLLRAQREVGRLLLEAGRLDEAESALRTAVQRARAEPDPRDLGLGLLWLGRALLRLGRADRALLAFAEAVGLLEDADPPAAEEARAAVAGVDAAPPGAR